MAQQENLEKILIELTRYYKSNPYKKSLYTLPEIFGRERRENFISDWFAYLLDPDKNGFGMKPLVALCEYFEVDISDADKVEIKRENTFFDGKRIDLYINIFKENTKILLIGIENKIDSREEESQTLSYYKRLREIANGEVDILPIYLRPDTNTKEAECREFKNLYYSELKSIFESIPYDIKRDARKNFYFYEFILYMEEFLMNKTESGFPILSMDAEIFRDNKETIEKARIAYEDYTRSLKAWFDEEFKRVYAKEIIICEKPKYWQFFENMKWKELNFHFELLSKEKDITELTFKDKNVFLRADLEEASDKVSKLFEKKSRSPALHTVEIQVDFSSEENVLLSIEEIVSRLKSDEFHRYTNKANDFFGINP